MTVSGSIYKAGLNNVGNYQVSGVPFIKRATLVAGDEVKVEFPSVARNITIQLDSSTGGEIDNGSYKVTNNDGGVATQGQAWATNGKEFTISFWAKVNETPGAVPGGMLSIIGISDSSSTSANPTSGAALFGFNIQNITNSYRLNYRQYQRSSGTTSYKGADITGGDWSNWQFYTLVGTEDGVMVYVNNVHLGTVTMTSEYTLNTADWNYIQIGDPAGSSSDSAKINIVDLVVWDRALEAVDISAIYNGGNEYDYKTPLPVRTSYPSSSFVYSLEGNYTKTYAAKTDEAGVSLSNPEQYSYTSGNKGIKVDNPQDNSKFQILLPKGWKHNGVTLTGRKPLWIEQVNTLPGSVADGIDMSIKIESDVAGTTKNVVDAINGLGTTAQYKVNTTTMPGGMTEGLPGLSASMSPDTNGGVDTWVSSEQDSSLAQYLRIRASSPSAITGWINLPAGTAAGEVPYRDQVKPGYQIFDDVKGGFTVRNTNCDYPISISVPNAGGGTPESQLGNALGMPISISFWFRLLEDPATHGSSFACVYGFSPDDATVGFHYARINDWGTPGGNDAEWQWVIRTHGGYTLGRVVTGMPDPREWHHYVIQYGRTNPGLGNLPRIWIDGVDTVNWGSDSSTDQADWEEGWALTIGGPYNGGNNAAVGEYKDVIAWYHTPLWTTDRATHLYNLSSTNQDITNIFQTGSGATFGLHYDSGADGTYSGGAHGIIVKSANVTNERWTLRTPAYWNSDADSSQTNWTFEANAGMASNPTTANRIYFKAGATAADSAANLAKCFAGETNTAICRYVDGDAANRPLWLSASISPSESRALDITLSASLSPRGELNQSGLWPQIVFKHYSPSAVTEQDAYFPPGTYSQHGNSAFYGWARTLKGPLMTQWYLPQTASTNGATIALRDTSEYIYNHASGSGARGYFGSGIPGNNKMFMYLTGATRYPASGSLVDNLYNWNWDWFGDDVNAQKLIWYNFDTNATSDGWPDDTTSKLWNRSLERRAILNTNTDFPSASASMPNPAYGEYEAEVPPGYPAAIDAGGGSVYMSFKSTGSYSNVITNKHYWKLENKNDKLTMNIKAKEIYLSAVGGDCSYSVHADLTNISTDRMFALTGSGIDE